MNRLDCEHCRMLRGYVDRAAERLGRPPDSFDHLDVVPFHALPRIADVQHCACTCHSHLAIVGRWTPAE